MDAKPELLELMQMPPRVAETMAGRYKVHALWDAADKKALLADVADAITGVLTMGHGGCTADLMGQ